MDLKVRIPKRYKNTLSKRFNPKYTKIINKNDSECYRVYAITIACPLCGVHLGRSCGNCPFMKFNSKLLKRRGCMRWIDRIYGKKERYWFVGTWGIQYNNYDKHKAIKSLNWFRDRAEELIEWI